MNPIQNILEQFDFPVYLAPMEEVTDPPFRHICKEFGADILISEFISSDALSREVEKSIKKMHFCKWLYNGTYSSLTGGAF